MSENINNMLVYRDSMQKEIQDTLNMYASYVEEAVTYGTQLLFLKAEGHKDESPVSDLLLRNFLDLLDSLSILVKKGASEASRIILRSLFEINLSLHFICEKLTDMRAYSFLAVDKLNAMKELDRLHSNTDAGKQLKAKILKENWLPNFGLKHSDQNIEAAKEDLKTYLASPHFKDVIEEYESIKIARNGKGNIKWYSLFGGADTIEGLAKVLNKSTVYEVLYREWSKSTHGVNIIKDKFIEADNGQGFFRPLREPTGLMLVTKYACNFAINTFGYFVQSRHLKSASEYQDWEKKFTENYSDDLDHEYINFKEQ